MDVWIGLSLSKEEDDSFEAQWVTGDKVLFTNWGAEQPGTFIKSPLYIRNFYTIFSYISVAYLTISMFFLNFSN